ncbi:protein-domain-containing protein [Mucor mucedo]|uniref:protein-domain-containing protein n=1 Tax=Mucor mucedo TaxID=29922 RepID=UPI00221E51FC|nr:protein-domain-containing protein [Mucor mucedo]KAI7892878.1 protein-domain-containing protein [Mucor mucedo]
MAPSKIYDFDPIEADDELELELSKLYANHRAAAENKSELELHNYLQDRASINKKEYHDVVCALLYGVLTEPENARLFFQSISFVNRDHFGNIIMKLQALIISIKFPCMKIAVREQIFWLISELTNLGVQNVDSLYLCLLRQIRSGDMSQPNLLLCDQLLKLFELHKSWLDSNIRLIPTFVYTYLKVIADHQKVQLQSLQQKEIKFVMTLLKEKWLACCDIGRDLIRVLHDLSLTIPEFTQFWEVLLNNPQKLSPRFGGIETLLKTPTKKEYLRCRLTPDIEFKLLFILQNLRSNQYQRNLNWFIQRYLSTPESEPFYVDVVRYLVAGWYPSNQILQSDIVPRYVVIGSMIRSIKNKTVVANVKTALIYDWLFFTPTDNIMFIEPAMLLMERSAERYPYITSVIMEFLKNSVDDYFPPLKEYMARCVACGMRVLLSKGVIRSLMPIYKCPSTEPTTREYMQALFSEFLTDEASVHALPMPTHLQATPSIPGTPKTEGYVTEEELEEGEEPATTSTTNTTATATITTTTPAAVHHVDDDDVDEYLYGDSDTKPKTAEQEDEDMEENPLSTLSTSFEPDQEDREEVQTPVKEESVAPGSIAGDDPDDVEQMATDDDFEDEVDEVENIQSNQSYWIFGDSLKRFKESSAAVTLAQKKEGDQTNYATNLHTAKKSLKEILAVFLRMAIPPETLVPTIGPYVRNMVASNMLEHVTTFEKSNDVEAILEDPSKDVFDLIMATFWSVRDNDASREKLIRLIGCISHTKKNKGKRHIIGMRWWSFIAIQLEADENSDIPSADNWFPGILSNYEIYVLHAYAIEESTIDQSEYLKDYLKQDLYILAEQSVVFFNDIIPLLYQYLPNATVGNMDILNLTVMMLLPESMGKLVCRLHYGSIKVFGDKVDVILLNNSLSLATYETMCFWQLLAAELQGNSNYIELFFSEPQILDILRTKFKNEIISSLFSILTSTKPTKDLIYSIIRIIPENFKTTEPQVQFALASFQYWSTNMTKVFLTAVSQLTNSFVKQIETGKEYDVTCAATFVSIMMTWWNQKLTSETFKKDKALLAVLSKLGDSVNQSYPKEWQAAPVENRRKKRSIMLESDEE